MSKKIITVKQNISLFLVIAALLFFMGIHQSNGQSIKVLAGNTLNGAMNGTMLGGATMALDNSPDFAPVRIGLGLGTLYGIGIGAYDLSETIKGQQFYISGTLNDGDNSTIIVLLDTFYGAAAGAVIGTSFILIANENITQGLQYGSGVGAWIGFGFGLFDAFVLSERPNDFAASLSGHEGNGLVSYVSKEKRFQAGLINPAIYSFSKVSRSSLDRTYVPGLEIINLKIEL